MGGQGSAAADDMDAVLAVGEAERQQAAAAAAELVSAQAELADLQQAVSTAERAAVDAERLTAPKMCVPSLCCCSRRGIKIGGPKIKP